MTTEEFIKQHHEDDVRQLALQGGRYPDMDMTFALQQIAGWQTARRKLPSWAETEGIVYPPHLSMEQCSSEQTARYKASLVSKFGGTGVQGYEICSSAEGNLVPSHPRTPEPPNKAMVDLTGGLGVDFAFMAKAFDKAVYVERQPHLCEAARKNFPLLGLERAEVVCGDGVDFLHQLDHASCIFLDPARRDQHGSRTYAMSDCTPDVLALKDELLEKADWVMVKLSPMLDWHKAVGDLNESGDVVREVHIVSVGNECKELLLVLSLRNGMPLTVHCVNDGEDFHYSPSVHLKAFTKVCKTDDFEPFHRDNEDSSPTEKCTSTQNTLFTPLYLYEPNSSVMKAGCFNVLQERFRATQLSHDSHLFVSNHFIEDFPGRKFLISTISSMKEIKGILKNLQLTNAHVAIRNFPMTANELRKRLRLKDGGDTYIFGTTLEGGKHRLLIGSKVIKS